MLGRVPGCLHVSGRVTPPEGERGRLSREPPDCLLLNLEGVPVAATVQPKVPFLDRLHHPEELALRVEEAADCVKSVAVAHPEPSVAEPLEMSVASLHGVWAALRAMSALMSAERIAAASDQEKSLYAALRRLGKLLDDLARHSDGVARAMERHLQELTPRPQEPMEARAKRIENVAQAVRQSARNLRNEATGLAERVEGERRELADARAGLAEAHKAALLKGLPGVVSLQEFEHYLESLLSQPGRVRTSWCVALVAADRLEEITTSLGVFTADALFFQVGRLVQATASSHSDALVGLYREWELGIVLPSCSLGKGRQVLEELQARVGHTAWECKAGSHKEVITITISSALTQPRYGESVESLKARLEELLAQARSRGGNDLVLSR